MKRYSVTVRGKLKTWSFTIDARPEHVADLRADGLEVDEVGNVIPEWVADAGLARAWIFCEDVLNFRWPFARGEAGKDKGE